MCASCAVGARGTWLGVAQVAQLLRLAHFTTKIPWHLALS